MKLDLQGVDLEERGCVGCAGQGNSSWNCCMKKEYIFNKK